MQTGNCLNGVDRLPLWWERQASLLPVLVWNGGVAVEISFFHPLSPTTARVASENRDRGARSTLTSSV